VLLCPARAPKGRSAAAYAEGRYHAIEPNQQEEERVSAIVDYMFGHNNNIDTISEAEARRIAPQAFTSRK